MKRLLITNLILCMILCIIPKDIKTTEIAVNKPVVNNVEPISNRSLTETREKVVEVQATGISQEGIDLIKQFERL